VLDEYRKDAIELCDRATELVAGPISHRRAPRPP
jgi:hypothetical protein